MLALELRFLGGRFHATPWGRNVNEGIPEWPPSPFRLARALYDAWKRKRPDWPATRVEPLMRALSGRDVLFHLPPARMSHLRLFYRQGSEVESDKKKVFDAFVVLSPDTPVYIGLPSASLTAGQRANLQELSSLPIYFGRAESLASLQVADRDGPWNCRPAEAAEPSQSTDVVRVACLCAPGRHDAVIVSPARSATKKKPAQAGETLAWLEAIAWGSEMTIRHRLSQPPALEWTPYRRPSDALAAVPGPRAPRRTIEADTVILAVDGRVPPRVLESVRVGDEIRRRAMGAHRRIMGGDRTKVSPRFSGKDPSGIRLAHGHLHASFLAWDRDADGVVDHVIVTSPGGFDRHELLALHRLAPLDFPSREHPARLIPIAVGRRDAIFAPSTSFRSTTPFLPTRHHRGKRDGSFGAWLRAEVSRSLRDHHMPEVVSLEPLDHHEIDGGRRLRWLEFRRARRGEPPRLGFGFRIVLRSPVSGPFSIGAGAHFGLGLFVPL